MGTRVLHIRNGTQGSVRRVEKDRGEGLTMSNVCEE